jgi:polysaccharide export outer membrane protein
MDALSPCKRLLTTGLGIALSLLVGTMAPADDAYEIGTLDVLSVAVVGQAEMTGNMAVDSEGLLNFPILGKVKAAGLTCKDLERKLTTLLSDGYLKRPQVNVTIAEFKSQRIFVTGEVAKPGAYSLKGDRSLLTLLADVGSLTQNAGDEIHILRPPAVPLEETEETPPETEKPRFSVTAPPPGTEVKKISVDDLRSGRPEFDIVLRNGDTVYVAPAEQVFVSGHVLRPGAYRFKPGITVFQVLTLAGGVTERGSSGRVKVVRILGEKKQESKVKATDVLQPGDTLIVPERFF